MPIQNRPSPCTAIVLVFCRLAPARRANTPLLALVGALLLATAAAAQTPAESPATHGRDAVPDYARVFPQDRTTRLDITVPAAEWQRLMDDMATMSGAFGSGTGGPGGGPGGGGPGGGLPGGGLVPPTAQAIAACTGKVEGDVCQFGTPVASGRCTRTQGAATLACVALAGGPGGGLPGGGNPIGGGGGGRDDVELLPRTPVYVRATVAFDGLAFSSVGLRLKGNSSLLNSWRAGVLKLPLRLNFDEFEGEVPAVRDQTFFGFQNINLSNNSMDASFLHAKVGHDLFREAGLPSSSTSFTRVYLDRGEGPVYLGLYTMVEIPGRALLNAQFGGAGGNVYKPNGTGARWTQFVEASFPKKTNEDEADWSDIQEAIAALNASRASPGAWRARLEAAFNVDDFLRWLALNTLIGNFDTYGGLAPHNYYLYGDPRQRDRLQWIPWDLDLAFGSMGGAGGGTGTLDLFHVAVDASWPLIRFLMDDATYRAKYRTHVEELLGTVFHTGSLTARLRETHGRIAADVVGPGGEESGRTFLDMPEEFTRALTTLVSYIESRAEAVRRALAAAQ